MDYDRELTDEEMAEVDRILAPLIASIEQATREAEADLNRILAENQCRLLEFWCWLPSACTPSRHLLK